jgi:hypothetical protein
MLIDRTHKPWLALFALLTLAATALYGWYAAVWPGGPAGRTWPGMIFGVVATALMIFAGLLTARKRTVRLRLGSLAWWLKAHIWLGLVTVPLVFFHTAFRWGGTLELTLMIVFLAVIASGIIGVSLQNVLPRLMRTDLDAEVIPDQLDRLCQVLQRDADTLVTAACGAKVEQALARDRRAGSTSTGDSEAWLVALYLDTIRPYLAPGRAVSSVLATGRQAELVFERARHSVPDKLHATLDGLEDLCRTRRDLHTQARLYGILHGWMKLHLPLSVALLVFALLHIVTALYY